MNAGENQPLVSIITVNFNQIEVTRSLLISLTANEYKNIEIIVVDNNSTQGNIDELKAEFPQIILVKSNTNLGFAGGNNLGIQISKGEYLLFINNDTEVPPNFLFPLISKLQTDTSIGVISPKILFYQNPDIIQFAGYTPLNRLTMRNNLIGYRQKDDGKFDQSGFTPFAHGAAMLLPRRVIQDVGLMADIFFLYYEEHDWFERIKKKGYKIYYCAESKIYHKESMSTGKDSPLKIHYIARNRILFMRRNLTGYQFVFSLLFQIFVSIPKGYTMYFLKGKTKHLSAFHKAILWNVKNIFNSELHQNSTIKN